MSIETELSPVQLLEVAARASELPWQHVVALGPEYRVRLSVTHGAGVWHHHPNTSETFVVLDGTLHLEFEDRPALTLTAGDLLCVPPNLVHRSRSEGRCVSLSVETLEPEVVLEPHLETHLEDNT